MTYIFLSICLLISIFIAPAHAGMPQLSPEEQAELEQFMQSPEGQQFIKEMEEFAKEYEKLSPAEKKKLEEQAREDLKRSGFDPDTYQPIEPSQPTPPSTPKTPQASQEPAPDCSPEATHSCKEAELLIKKTILYLEEVRQKLNSLNLDTATIQEWLGALTYYLKIMDHQDHSKRLTSVDFAHLFDLIARLERLLRTESTSLIPLTETDEEESRIDDPYAILGIPYDASEEEIKKAYEQKFAAHDPEALKKELELSKTSPTKIAKRMQRATAQQAILTEAYEQLRNPESREQLDQSRSTIQEQKLAARAATEESIERLYDGLNDLVQQGLIKGLEGFFTRYAPTELSYHQQMEKAEKERIDEQRAASGLKPIPSPLGGFPWGGGYQSPSYYPGNNYYSPNYPSSYSPQTGSEGSGGKSGGSGAGGDGEKSKGADKGDKKKDDKKDEKKKDGDKKDGKKDEKKDKKDDVEAIAKEFTKLLEACKDPISKLKDYTEADEQEVLRSNLALLETPAQQAPVKGTRAKKNKPITDGSFKGLHDALNKYISPGLLTKLQQLIQFVQEKIVPNKKALEACKPIWEQSLLANYPFLDTLCRQTTKALQENKKLEEEIPWNNVYITCRAIGFLRDIFKKTEEKNNKAEKDKKGKKPQEKTKSAPDETSPEELGEKEKSEKEEKDGKERPLPTKEQIEQAVKILKVACDKVTSNIGQGDNKAKLKKLIKETSDALATQDLTTILTARDNLDAFLANIHFDIVTKSQAHLKNIQRRLPAELNETIDKLIKEAKISKYTYPDLWEIQSINRDLHKFLYPGPYEVINEETPKEPVAVETEKPEEEKKRKEAQDELETKIINILNAPSRPKIDEETKELISKLREARPKERDQKHLVTKIMERLKGNPKEVEEELKKDLEALLAMPTSTRGS